MTKSFISEQKPVEGQKQINPARALNELTHWATQRNGYVQIVFYGNPHFEKVNEVEIPHPWLCLIYNGWENCSGWGVTMDEAIVRCFEGWQKGEIREALENV